MFHPPANGFREVADHVVEHVFLGKVRLDLPEFVEDGGILANLR